MKVTAAIPPVFDAYATIVLHGNGEDQRRHKPDHARPAGQPAGQRWWLDTFSASDDDMVCPSVTMAAMPKGDHLTRVAVRAGGGRSWASRRLAEEEAGLGEPHP